MSKQYSLFDDPKEVLAEDEKKATSNQGKITLVIDKEASSKDQKKKKTIDKKIEKIDTLKKQIEKINKQIADIKELHSKKAVKVENEFYKTKEDFILKLYNRSKEKGFTLWQIDLMHRLIVNECTFLSNNEYFSDVIDKVQKEVIEIKLKNLNEEEQKDLNSIYEDAFEEIDIDLGKDFDLNRMKEPGYAERIFEQFHQKNEEFKNEEKIKDRKDKVQNTDKDFQKLYKQLVRKVHPDLVKSDKEKEEREVTMKKLTEAWEQRNYFELLVLQKEIEGEVNTESFIGVSQLDTLTKQLNDEIAKLEQEKWMLKSRMGKNYFYVKNFFARTKKGIEKKINQYIFHIENEKTFEKSKLTYLKSKASTKKFLKKMNDFEDAFSDVFY